MCAWAGFAWLFWGSAPLGATPGVIVLVGGVVVAVAVTVALRGVQAGGSPATYGRGYWGIFATQFAAIAVGAAVLVLWLDAPGAVAGWIALVVGAHFVGLAAVMHAPRLRPVGALVVAAGLAGLVAAAAGADDDVATSTAALTTGVVLLGAAVDIARRARAADRDVGRDPVGRPTD